MYQVIYKIPFRFFAWLPDWWPDYLPIFGYGLMLFCAFLATTWLASWRAKKEGVDKVYIQDLALWIFGLGILGARVTYMIQYRDDFRGQNLFLSFFQLWKGGLVFYGSFIGGLIGYVLAHF